MGWLLRGFSESSSSSGGDTTEDSRLARWKWIGGADEQAATMLDHESWERDKVETLTHRWSPHNRNILASTSYDMSCRSYVPPVSNHHTPTSCGCKTDN